MAKSMTPIAPGMPITPAMANNARKAIGACNSCSEKLAAFESAGIEFPDEKALNEDMRQKASALLAAYELYSQYGKDSSGT
jgi:hypothetical protein